MAQRDERDARRDERRDARRAERGQGRWQDRDAARERVGSRTERLGRDQRLDPTRSRFDQSTHGPFGQRTNAAPRGGVFGDRRPGYLPRDAHGNRRSSAGAWIVGILLLIGLGVILWFVLTRGSTSSVLTPNTQGSLSATGPRITADTGQDLFAVANDPTALTNLEDHTVAASNVNVLSVVSDQGIWVGTSQSAALFVFTGPQQSVTQVAAGDTVDFSGVLKVLPVDYQTRFGIDATEGASQLQTQGHYIDASTSPVMSAG